MNDPHIWYRDKDIVHIGGVRRYHIKYTKQDDRHDIFFRLKNIEKAPIRAIHMLNGPFILYCHVIPWNYHHNEPLKQDSREVHFNNELKPGQTFNIKLLLNDNSKIHDNVYGWKIDIISQIVITSNTSILYDMLIGDDLAVLKKVNKGPFKSLTTLSGDSVTYMKLNEASNPQLSVQKFTDKEIWSRAPKYDQPVHLVILTHGIFSNLTADMLYLKESLESNVDDNLLIKGFDGNAGKTEGGVKKLGSKQGKYLITLIDNLLSQDIEIEKISFIGHSLGGLVQLYSIKYMLDHEKDFFTKRHIKPHNLVFMASPLLGILNEISFILSWLLDLGTLGKTGRDLTLSRSKLKGRALLDELPEDLHEFMKSCSNLIIYANIINDGIVPLRTSALLYLDYVTLDDVRAIKHNKDNEDTDIDSISSKKKNSSFKKYKQLVSLNFNLNGTRKRDKLLKKILRINAKGTDNLSDSNASTPVEKRSKSSFNDNEDHENDDNNSVELSQEEAEDIDHMDDNTALQYSEALNLPPKASIVQSALNTIICPVPNQDYIINPEDREPVIFHDRFYQHNDIPADEEVTGLFQKPRKQVRIAQKYHDELNWRKILVKLPPDAHNNIVVRRRFSNGYGWGVIDHLCQVFNETNARPLERLKSKI